MNFDPFNCSLRVNNKIMWDEYFSIFMPRTWNYLHLDGINLYRDDVITSIETSLLIETTGKRWDCSWEFIKRQGPKFRNANFVGGLTCTHLLYQVILLIWTDIEFIYKHIILWNKTKWKLKMYARYTYTIFAISFISSHTATYIRSFGVGTEGVRVALVFNRTFIDV